jgi:hypothetical protein
MNQTKRLKGVCTECGGSIEFMAEAIGTLAQCPRCRKQTELLLAPPPVEPLIPRRVVIWTAVMSAVLLLGAVGVVIGLKHFEKVAAQQKGLRGAGVPVVPPGLAISAIAVETEPGATECYVVGTVDNTSDRQFMGVAVQLDTFDATGQKLGVVRAYRPAVAPGARWQFRVSTGDRKAVSAKLASVKEGQ